MRLPCTSEVKEAEKRCKFVDWAYKATRRVHENATDEEAVVKNEHRKIYNAIRRGDVANAEWLMKNHLQQNRIEGLKRLYEKLRDKKKPLT